jgi:hypothetical protein
MLVRPEIEGLPANSGPWSSTSRRHEVFERRVVERQIRHPP